MAEGGALPWKRQVIDQSRGPAGNYDAVHKALPDIPHGVAWQQNPTTREWTLVRVDQQQERDRQMYKLERTTVWNPHTGREQLAVKPVLKTLNDAAAQDADTVATVASDEDTPPLPVLGKDYVVHTVVPSDTFSGLCLRYKIKAVTLRRVNHFSGTNLALSPSKLLIPLGNGVSIDQLRLQDTSSTEYKMQMVLNEFPSLPAMERKAYLEMNDWDVPKTIEQIRQDFEWEQKQVFTAVPIVENKGFRPLEVESK